MEIKQGQIWKIKAVIRPDVEIARYDSYSETVYWRYVDNKSVFETKKDYFERDFELKKDI
jgi:hypothetical protein